MCRVELTWLEMFAACMVGVSRRLSSMARGLDTYKHTKNSNFQTDIEGAIAEACCAKHLGLYWSASINTFKAPDVASLQVRSTAHRDGHLIIRPNDQKLDERVVLAITDGFGATLVGWMEVREARVDRFWRAKESSWWVPQEELYSLSSIYAQDEVA